MRDAARRLGDSELPGQRLEAPTIFGQVDRVGRGAEDRDPGLLEAARQLERRLPAELHHHADRLLDVHDLEHVLERERLEVQRVGDVEVGGDRLRIGVHHHGAIAQLAERQRRAHAAVVELDTLPDAVGAAAENHDGAVADGAEPRSPRRSEE